jgi:hypothetical protein
MYQAVYKCRLCGETFVNKGSMIKDESDDNFDEENDTTVTDAIWDVISGADDYDSCCDYSLIGTHCCQDGSIGIADFQGFKKASD